MNHVKTLSVRGGEGLKPERGSPVCFWGSRILKPTKLKIVTYLYFLSPTENWQDAKTITLKTIVSSLPVPNETAKIFQEKVPADITVVKCSHPFQKGEHFYGEQTKTCISVWMFTKAQTWRSFFSCPTVPTQRALVLKTNQHSEWFTFIRSKVTKYLCFGTKHSASRKRMCVMCPSLRFPWTGRSICLFFFPYCHYSSSSGCEVASHGCDLHFPND